MKRSLGPLLTLSLLILVTAGVSAEPQTKSLIINPKESFEVRMWADRGGESAYRGKGYSFI